MNVNYILFHGNCYDGFGAAFAAWKKFGSSAKYIPVSYGDPPPKMPNATTIYILDFSYPKDVILDLAKRAQVVVLDHHKTAQADLESLIRTDHNGSPEIFNPHIVFDMNRSGAKIAWEFFHSDSSGAVPTSRLIEHISDRDLWRFELPGTREVHSALVSLPFDFEVWDKLDVDDLIKEGAACLRFESSVVDKIIKSAWVGELAGYRVPMVNTAAHWSEVGHALLIKYPSSPFVASFTVFHDQVMWSLRSVGDFDVSEVAKRFGGGGHKNAAGFRAPRF